LLKETTGAFDGVNYIVVKSLLMLMKFSTSLISLWWFSDLGFYSHGIPRVNKKLSQLLF